MTSGGNETKQSLVQSSSSFDSSSSFQYRDLSSSRDNEQSSDSASVDKQLRPFELNTRPNPPLTNRKSSDDDEVCEFNSRYLRTRKANGRRCLLKRKLVNSSGSANCNSSAYPSSTTSSIKESSSSEGLSPDSTEANKCMITLSLNTEVANHALERHIESSDIKQVEEIKWASGKLKGNYEQAQKFTTDQNKLSTSVPNGLNFPPIIPEKHRIIFNAAGKLFEADQRLLDKYPETVLGGHKSRMRFYDMKKNEYFFDRHREVFEAVLQFYTNGGTLARPSHIPLDIFVNEIRFYSFDYETIENFLRDEGLLLIEKKKLLPNGKIRRIIWRLFEDTEYSWCSKVVTLISALVITVSVVVFCLETRPAFTSLSNNVTEQIRPSLEACQRSLNGQHSARSNQSNSNNQFNKTAYSEYLLDETILGNKLEALVGLVKATLQICVETEDLPVSYRYTVARCLLEVDDERRYFNYLLNQLKRHQSNQKKIVESKLRHKRLRKTEPTEVTNSKLLNLSEFHPNEITNNSRINQTIPNALIHLMDRTCTKLDNVSRRSPYAWFVLEAKMGSPAGILFLTETSCIVWFVLELGLRFGTCPDRKAFCKSFLNIVDASAILPYFITMIVISIENSSHLRPQTATILRTIRLVRMLRILKLSRYSRGFRILGLTLIRSTRVLFLLVCFQMVLAIVFSSVVYFVEYDAPGTQFTSIPDSFWWALITMTTVGYGDVVPITVLGKIAGASCAIMGILCISFPVPVIVSNFNYLYNRDKDDCKLIPEDILGDESEQILEQKDFKNLDKL